MESRLKNSSDDIGSDLPFAIVGLGVIPEISITFEACSRLENAEIIFMIEPLHVAQHLLPSFSNKISSLDFCFDIEKSRNQALNMISDEIIKNMAQYSSAAFALQGHPTFSCWPVQSIIAKFRSRHIAFEVITGVSSAAQYFADLAIDPFANGIQFVSGDKIHSISGQLPVLILSPGYADTIERFDRLIVLAKISSNLIRCYGEEAKFHIYTRRRSEIDVRFANALEIIDIAEHDYLGNVLISGPITML